MAKEIVLIKPTWVEGEIKPVETVVSLPNADAQYLVSIGRAEYVKGGESAEGGEKPAKKGRK
jgi:hypothetical protein